MVAGERSLTYHRRRELSRVAFVVGVRERARPLPPGDRREAILVAVLPLLREKGRDVTSRELAEAAGVAEGTLFRAFGDKETRCSPPGSRSFSTRSRSAPNCAASHPDLPLRRQGRGDHRTAAGAVPRGVPDLTLFQVHGRRRDPMRRRDDWLEIVRELLEPDLHRLAVPVEMLGLLSAARGVRLLDRAVQHPTPSTPPCSPGSSCAACRLDGSRAHSPAHRDQHLSASRRPAAA